MFSEIVESIFILENHDLRPVVLKSHDTHDTDGRSRSHETFAVEFQGFLMGDVSSSRGS